jgi:hypothetical protein
MRYILGWTYARWYGPPDVEPPNGCDPPTFIDLRFTLAEELGCDVAEVHLDFTYSPPVAVESESWSTIKALYGAAE